MKRKAISRLTRLRSLKLRDMVRELEDIRTRVAELDESVILADPAVTAATPGTVVMKIEVFDVNGNSLGFMAIYDAIT